MVFIIFLSSTILKIFLLYKENLVVNGIFDDINVSNPPPSKEIVDGKISVIANRFKNIKKTESSIAFLIFLLLMLSVSISRNHPLSSDLFSLLLVLNALFLFFFLKAVDEIKIECSTNNKNISFVRYGDIQECDVEFIRTSGAAREYLRSVALSERELTNYEINMLMEFVHKEKDKNREKSIIESVKKP